MLVLPNQGKVPVLSHSLVAFSSQINIRACWGCWLASAAQGSAALVGHVPPICSPDAKLKNKCLMRTAQQVRFKVDSASAPPLPANRCLRKKRRKGQVFKSEEKGKHLTIPPQHLLCSVRARTRKSPVHNHLTARE